MFDSILELMLFSYYIVDIVPKLSQNQDI